jgi:hypothetical protein
MDEEDMVDPVVSTLDILKAQRARKAAARQQAEKAAESSVTESESEPEAQQPERAVSPSFSDLPNGSHPPGLRRHEDITMNNDAGTAQYNLVPIRPTNTRPPTPPLASTSAAIPGHLRPAPSSDPPQGHASKASQQPHAHQTKTLQKQRSSPVGHHSQASQQPRAGKTQSTQKKHSSSVGKSHHPKKTVQKT